jgi:hypothetical protein
MKRFKLERVILIGSVEDDLTSGEQLIFEKDIDISSAIVKSVIDGKVVMEYETQKENFKGDDITPVIECSTIDDLEDCGYVMDSKELVPRSATEDEINSLNEYFKREVRDSAFPMDTDFVPVGPNSLKVFEINEDYKILIHLTCSVMSYSDGNPSVLFDSMKYALRYGTIYSYDDEDHLDDVDIDISDITNLLN